MLLEQKVEIHISPSNRKHFENLGYKCGKNGSVILVNVHHLKPYSRAEVKVRCDFCGKIFTQPYNSYMTSEFRDLNSCKKCVSKKIKYIFNLKYGVDNISQLPETQKKIKNNNLLKYGVDSTSKLESTKEKRKATSLKRYGVDHPAKSKIIQEERKKISQEKYGCDYWIAAPQTREKIHQSFQERYGVDNPSQIDSVMEKIQNSKYSIGNQTSSSQQRQLFKFLGGELNYPFKRFFIDIAFPEEKIAVEYIGGGHNLSVKLGNISQKEFDRNENFRRKLLFESEWVIIEFISLKNKMLDGDTSKRVFEFCYNLIKNHNKHYIKVYIDENKIMSGNDKICYKNTLNDWNEKTS